MGALCASGMANNEAAVEISVGNVHKTKIHTPDDPAKPFFGICPKDSVSCFTVICSAMFIGAIFTAARKLKQPKCLSTNGWIIKNLEHRHYGISVVKKNEITNLVDKWVGLEKRVR